MPFYGVKHGRIPGVYKTWLECKQQVDGYTNPKFRKFRSEVEALEFVKSGVLQPQQKNDNPGKTHFSKGQYNGLQQKSYKPKEKRCTGTKLLDEVPAQQQQSSSCPVVYTDGCCFANGKCGAKAGIGVYWGPQHPRNIAERLKGTPTNQRAELTAAAKAIEGAIEMGYSEVELRTDSMYTINSITSWIKKWKKNKWKSVKGEDVKNKEEIRLLDELCQRVNVKWVHVLGHTGIFGNTEADRLSKEGAMKEVEQ